MSSSHSASETHPPPNGSTTEVGTDTNTNDDGTHTASIHSTSKSPCLSCWPPYGGNDEALGWALDGIGRSVSFTAAAVFVGTALLNQAKLAAGCETEIPEGETTLPECNGKVYGIRPSSLLTTYSTVVGLVSSALLPLVGSFIDHSRHRREAGRITALLLCMLLIPLVFVSEETWFALAIILLIVAFLGWIHTSVAFAYLPELTDDEIELVKLTASFTIVQYAATVIFLVVMIGLLYILGLTDDEVVSARIAQSVSAVVTSIVFGWAWTRCFGERPAFQDIPPGSTIWSAGFKKVYHTTIRIYKSFSALKWFFVGIAFGEAASQSLATIAITYLTDVMALNSTENGIAILLLFIGSVPGALISKKFTLCINALWSAKVSVGIMAAITGLAALFLTGPGQQIRVYCIAFGWGIGTGWKYTAERCIVCQIIPEGQDAELMGYYLFAGQILIWLPSLIFTIINEQGVNMRIGIASVGGFFLVTLFAYFLMGPYAEAIRIANENGEADDTEPCDNSPSISGEKESAGSDQESFPDEFPPEGDEKPHEKA